MPDDDWALGQNDVRNEALKERWRQNFADDVRRLHANVDGTVDRDLADAVDHLRRLNETMSINEDAEKRRQESITRTLDEIQRLMDG